MCGTRTHAGGIGRPGSSPSGTGTIPAPTVGPLRFHTTPDTLANRSASAGPGLRAICRHRRATAAFMSALPAMSVSVRAPVRERNRTFAADEVLLKELEDDVLDVADVDLVDQPVDALLQCLPHHPCGGCVFRVCVEGWVRARVGRATEASSMQMVCRSAAPTLRRLLMNPWRQHGRRYKVRHGLQLWRRRRRLTLVLRAGLIRDSGLHSAEPGRRDVGASRLHLHSRRHRLCLATGPGLSTRVALDQLDLGGPAAGAALRGRLGRLLGAPGFGRRIVFGAAKRKVQTRGLPKSEVEYGRHHHTQWASSSTKALGTRGCAGTAEVSAASAGPGRHIDGRLCLW